MRAKQNTKIAGSKVRPRLAVFRSIKHIYAQLIDDDSGKTLTSSSTLDKDFAIGANKSAMELAKTVGEKLATKALGLGITKVVFDRRSRVYHGRIKALAEGARQSGLIF